MSSDTRIGLRIGTNNDGQGRRDISDRGDEKAAAVVDGSRARFVPMNKDDTLPVAVDDATPTT